MSSPKLVSGYRTEQRVGTPEVIYFGFDGNAARLAVINAPKHFLRVEFADVHFSRKVRSGLHEKAPIAQSVSVDLDLEGALRGANARIEDLLEILRARDARVSQLEADLEAALLALEEPAPTPELPEIAAAPVIETGGNPTTPNAEAAGPSLDASCDAPPADGPSLDLLPSDASQSGKAKKSKTA